MEALGLGLAWLYLPHPQLGGMTPKVALDSGLIDDVDRIIEQLETGAYV